MSDLKGLKKECLDCRKCLIGGKDIDGNTSNVFSNMNTSAKIMVVGQNPGKDEVAAGEPFVGASGKYFNKVLQEVVGISREDLYISNMVRCYTPENRRPRRSEMENCRGFLDREIELLDPEVIIALGGPALRQLTGVNGITKNCGEMIFSPRYKRYVLALLHPSPLNTNNPERRELFMSGLGKLKEYLEKEGIGGPSNSRRGQ